MDREKVIKGLECCLGANDCDVEPEEDCPYKGMCLCAMALRFDALELLKEQEAMNVDEFMQWCIDSHIMGDATVRGIKHWVGKFKEGRWS